MPAGPPGKQASGRWCGMIAAPRLQDGKDESEPLVHCGSRDSPVPCSYSTGTGPPKSIISVGKSGRTTQRGAVLGSPPRGAARMGGDELVPERRGRLVRVCPAYVARASHETGEGASRLLGLISVTVARLRWLGRPGARFEGKQLIG